MPDVVAELRRRAVAFAEDAGVSDELAYAIALAVSETVTNTVIHAYAGRDPGPVTVGVRAEDGVLVVVVADEGAGIEARHDSPGAGQGLAIVGALAESLDVASAPDRHGTVVTMTFAAAAPAQPPEAPALEPLCALALETIADVSVVDVDQGGVLRRIAAEVADDSKLTEWLRGALPPAKPGTATWAAMREGGARLVVHDPTTPRAPGGTGETLDLRWWVAVPLDATPDRPAALWGLGGRDGGHPVPDEPTLRALADAARTDLAQEPHRARLHGRLGR